MRIGEGLAQIGNTYIVPRYPNAPVNPISSVDVQQFSSISSMGGFNSFKAMSLKNFSMSNVTLTMPDGGMIVGYFIDLMA
ncbi:MAG TPA: hypothetical protein DHW82_03450 [Spirochaetia bacterium]|nr:MAG: hypothetical protein A2Y41_12840 [Spirochaetes bacterium GWB1_36_13]HCL56048.1 hypothetical protein [Spirochaetia bacterium]